VLDVRNIEIHVAHSCNLTCESCSHYSNQGHKGLLQLEEAERWMLAWNDRISPNVLSLLGGEPTTNPRLGDFVPLARSCWPASQIRLVTNGFLLSRHPDLPRRMAEDGNACLYLSVHHESPAYRSRLKPAIELLERWVREFGITVKVYPSSRWWRRTYRGFGAAMEPFEDNEPRSSWEKCNARFCQQLFEGRIWKCGPIAYLGLQHVRHGLSEKWRTYLDYRPLEPDCSDDELAAFFAREEEACCNMCPARPEHFVLPLPFPMRDHARSA
jgi:hypothetical protein